MLRKIVKKIPVLPSMYKLLRRGYSGNQLSSKSIEQVFNDIYRGNTWGGRDSFSGRGSDEHQTRTIVKELPILFSDFHISSMLDIPCGDFHWMKNVDLSKVDYIGADIVNDLVSSNTEKYGRNGVHFQKINLLKDELPKVDLVFCRDCLVHFSFNDIFYAFYNLCNSNSKYILTTVFADRINNHDIITGQWRVLNLERAPFLFPKPIKIINEGCTESNGAYIDKSLGLWELEDIRRSLKNRSI